METPFLLPEEVRPDDPDLEWIKDPEFQEEDEGREDSCTVIVINAYYLNFDSPKGSYHYVWVDMDDKSDFMLFKVDSGANISILPGTAVYNQFYD